MTGRVSAALYLKKQKAKKGGVKRRVKRPIKPWVNKNQVQLGKGFPKQIVVTHKYSDIITLVSTAGTYARYTLSANNVYDPDYTSAGHAPLFKSQMATLYDHFTVIASKATFKFMPANNSNTVPITCLVMLNDDVTLLSTNPIVNAEQTGATIKFLQMDAGNSLTIKKGFSAKKTYGPGVMANNKLAGTGTTSPSEQTFYDILIQSTDQAATQSVIIYYEIEYLTIWHELKDITPS